MDDPAKARTRNTKIDFMIYLFINPVNSGQCLVQVAVITIAMSRIIEGRHLLATGWLLSVFSLLKANRRSTDSRANRKPGLRSDSGNPACTGLPEGLFALVLQLVAGQQARNKVLGPGHQ